jgi:hypothetical protein
MLLTNPIGTENPRKFFNRAFGYNTGEQRN